MKPSLLVLLCIAACHTDDTPRSGLPRGRSLLSLDASEIDTLCEFAAAQAPVHDVICDGHTLPLGITKATCIARLPSLQRFPDCTATVLDAERCFDALGELSDADTCKLSDTFPPACTVLNTPPCS